MLPNFSTELDQEIELYERQTLESNNPKKVSFSELLEGVHFVRITGLSDFWKGKSSQEFVKKCSNFITSAHSNKQYFTMVITGDQKEIKLYFSSGDANNITKLLEAYFPGIRVQSNPIIDLGTQIGDNYKYGGMISGIPTVFSEETRKDEKEFYHIENVIRGMRGAEWIYIVHAYPREVEVVLKDRKLTLEKLSNIASISRQQIQTSKQKGTYRSDETISDVLSGEIVNRKADYVLQLLETELERLDEAQALGRWQVAIYYGASQQVFAKRLGALLQGNFGGSESRPQPIRQHPFNQNSSTKSEEFNTYLSSLELSAFIQLLREEFPGFAIYDYVEFDVDYVPTNTERINIGNILWEGNKTNVHYSLNKELLTKHAAVFGVTGSGKTTTIFNILDQVYNEYKVPFLVIEPAKTEYRALLGEIKNKTSSGPIPNLRVYTLGDDSVAPFRMNPFEFDFSSDNENSPLLSHIDYLKVVFNAAFILYAPMPYVLEIALHEIYKDKGWDLATGSNTRLDEAGKKNKDRFPIFPTLTDLYHKVETVTSRLGYEARIEQDVIAGLRARIGALRLGAKGLMLDTARGIPFEGLLSNPTVIEMENIGNDDEKTFLIGLLLARIYGYRQFQSKEGIPHDHLQHLLVIEEAHRLLRNSSAQVEVEDVNFHAQAINTFGNLLSEIRHYGQGVLVAEQIPLKLIPDVIKNTNLKIIHRIVAQEDRNFVGSAMNMNDQQIKHLTTLEAGKAVVFSEGDDHPYLLEIKNYKEEHSLSAPVDNLLMEISEKYISLSKYQLVPDFVEYNVIPTKFGFPSPSIYKSIFDLLSDPAMTRTWAKIITRIIYSRESLHSLIDDLQRQIEVQSLNLAPNQIPQAVNLLIVLGTAQSMEERGAYRGLSYTLIDNIRKPLTNGLIKIVKSKDVSTASSELDRFVRRYSNALERNYGPFPGCRFCQAICLYQEEVRNIMTKLDLHFIRDALADPGFDKNDVSSYKSPADVLCGIVGQWLDGRSSEIKELAYCTGMNALPHLGFNEYVQAEIARSLFKALKVS